MSTWQRTEEARIAAIAARDAYWRLYERHRWLNSVGVDRSLIPQLDEKRREMTRLEHAYMKELDVAVKSGEPHPEEP